MIAQMIESIMYFGIGFLLAALSVLVVAPLVHGRAVRLTTRRLEATIPLSMAEVQADKDLQRAEFAMSTRRLETTIEQLRTKSAGQLAELGRKGDAINRMKIELGTLRHHLSASEDEFMAKTRVALDAQRSSSEKQLAELKSELDEHSSIANVQKVEILALKAQVGMLSNRLAADGKTFETEAAVVPHLPTVPIDGSQSHPPPEVDAIPLVSTVPTDSPLIARCHGGDIVPLMPTAPVDSPQSPPVIDRSHEGNSVPPIPTVPMDSSQSRPTPTNQRRERDVFDSARKDRPIAEMPTAPTKSSQNPKNNQGRQGDVFHVASKDWPTTAGPPSPPPKHQRHEGDVRAFASKQSPIPKVQTGGPARHSDARHDASDPRIGTVRAGSDFSVEPSMRVAARRSGFKNKFPSGTSSIGRRTLRTLAACFIAALIGVGASSAWRSLGDKTTAMVRNWAPSLGWLASISTQSPPAPALAATSPEVARQLEAMPRDLAAVRRSLEQLAEKQEQMARNIAALRPFEHDTKKKASSPHLQSPTKLTPWPETRPTTIAGWTLRAVTNGTAILEGPNGTWRAMQGDTVPGVGRVESMVRWGNRLIVATSGGLISTP